MQKEKLHVVGIGASAGGLEAIQSLVDSLPDTLENTALIIVQHLSRDYKSMLPELIARRTKLKVTAVKDNETIKPNRIYVVSPTGDVVVEGTVLKILRSDGEGAHPSVNILFKSLASNEKIVGHAVVLSGTGKDGSYGLEYVRDQGGLIIAQDPTTAKYTGMPQSAIDTGLVDEVLAPNDIGKRIVDIKDRTKGANKSKKRMTNDHKIISLLEKRVGVDFSDYKSSTLKRRIEKRMYQNKLDDKSDYLDVLMQDPKELDMLFETILIGVTAFYRNEDVYKKLRPIIHKQVVEADGKKLRYWIPGCATGEEAYTYALLLEEVAERAGVVASYQIFATDVDLNALKFARLGVYKKDQIKAVPSNTLKNYFTKKTSDHYEISKEIRKNVLFSKHDVSSNPPFLRLDLISCRNLLIYFDLKLQKKVLPLFYYSLKNEGILVLGKSENISSHKDFFKTVASKEKIFARRTGVNKNIRLPKMKMLKNNDTTNSVDNTKPLSIGERVRETIYATYEKPYVVVNDAFEIMEMNGDVQRFLTFKQGTASLSIVKLIVSDLQVEVRALTRKAATTMMSVVGDTRKLKLAGVEDPVFVRILVKPLMYGDPGEPLFIVVFDEMHVDEHFFSSSKEVKVQHKSDHENELEHELDATKEHLNSLVEELETSNEELQSLNEEMQASNEELQASNEELETSNEELQATNEELDNAYNELRHANAEIKQRIDETEKAKKELSTVFNNSLVSFLMVDENYILKTFNKQAAALYDKLFATKLEADKIYTNFVPEDTFAEFQKSFKQAMSGKEVKAEKCFEIKDGSIIYVEANYSPVRRMKGQKYIKNVIVSFYDITDKKKAEKELLAANKSLKRDTTFLSMLTESMKSHIWTLDSEGHFLYANKVFLDYVGKTFEQLKNTPGEELAHPDELEYISRKWMKALDTKGELTVEHRLKSKNGDYHWFITQAKYIDPKKSLNGASWIAVTTNIDYTKKQELLEKDITMLEKAKQELINLNNLKDDFVSLASHQLRTPATAVKQYLAMTLGGYAGELEKKQAEFITIAYESNDRQLKIINDLLKTAQVDTGDLNIKKKIVNMVDLTKEVIINVKPYASSRGQEIKLSSKSNEINIVIDDSEIELVLTNLIENACKYSFDNATIKVSIKESASNVSVLVADQGVGLEESHMSKIFDKFTRVDNDLSDTVTGTGLGLYITRKIVEAHSGTIKVKSNKPKGTVFTVTLPKEKRI